MVTIKALFTEAINIDMIQHHGQGHLGQYNTLALILCKYNYKKNEIKSLDLKNNPD